MDILSGVPFQQADIAFLYTAFPFSSSEERRGIFIRGPADQARRSEIKALEKTAVFTFQQACDLPFQAGTALFSAAGQSNRVQERWLEKNAKAASAGQKPRLRHGGGGRHLQRHDFQTVSRAYSRPGFYGASVQKRPPPLLKTCACHAHPCPEQAGKEGHQHGTRHPPHRLSGKPRPPGPYLSCLLSCVCYVHGRAIRVPGQVYPQARGPASS